MAGSPGSSPDSQFEHRLIRGVWQPHTVDPKHQIDPFQAGPKHKLVQCFIVKDPVSQAYCLFLQLNTSLFFTNEGKFLLAGREISHLSHTEFSIWKDLDDLTEDSEYLSGKLLSNLSRTEYLLYDYRQCGAPRVTSCWRPHNGLRPGSTRVAEVHYNMTLGKPQEFHCVVHTVRYPSDSADGHVGPKRTTEFFHGNSGKILGAVPDFEDSEKPMPAEEVNSGDHEGELPIGKSSSYPRDSRPQKGGRNMRNSKSENSLPNMLGLGARNGAKINLKVDTAAGGEVDGPLKLKTKAYEWDDKMKIFYAKFENRENVQGSSKNFQLVVAHEDTEERDDTDIILQFGEATSDILFMDYKYPLTAFEAFGICLTRLD